MQPLMKYSQNQRKIFVIEFLLIVRASSLTITRGNRGGLDCIRKTTIFVCYIILLDVSV